MSERRKEFGLEALERPKLLSCGPHPPCSSEVWGLGEERKEIGRKIAVSYVLDSF